MSICYKENIIISPESLCDIITNSNHDIRQVLHNLSMWAAGDKTLTNEQVKISAEKAKKSLKLVRDVNFDEESNG
jgi:replication factor C subunit 1